MRHNQHVLLTEDDLIALKVHASFLKKMGLEVDLAVDGNEALEKYKKNYRKYKLAVLDVRMPCLSGFELAKCIRENEEKLKVQRMPIIMLSAELNNELVTKCNAIGINDFAQKPIQYINLKEILMKYIKINN